LSLFLFWSWSCACFGLGLGLGLGLDSGLGLGSEALILRNSKRQATVIASEENGFVDSEADGVVAGGCELIVIDRCMFGGT
jgi:hypothetical protein